MTDPKPDDRVRVLVTENHDEKVRAIHNGRSGKVLGVSVLLDDPHPDGTPWVAVYPPDWLERE